MRAYLLTAVRHECINRIRQMSFADQFRKLYPIEFSDDWQLDEQRMQTLDAIRDYAETHLTEPHLSIFRLRFEQDLKLKDIADRLDMNIKTVFKYLSQSIACIQKQFRV
jgi:RNA polymerase sigma factor (sigma-70 family)